jgi:hypothetical protein
VKPLSRVELRALLKTSRANNTRDGITGMLLYKDGNFMQVLEGHEAAVRATFRRIQRDPRHRGIIELLSGDAAEREFPDFSMGFRDLDSEDVREIAGYSEFLNTPLAGAEFSGDPSRCKKLLLTFKKSGSTF